MKYQTNEEPTQIKLTSAVDGRHVHIIGYMVTPSMPITISFEKFILFQ
jgi:hypothetical protein